LTSAEAWTWIRQDLARILGKFGLVEDVLLSNQHSIRSGSCFVARPQWNLLAALDGIALIIMQDWKDAATILAQGNFILNGYTIRIRAFEERKEAVTQNIESDEKACVDEAEDAETDAHDFVCLKISSSEPSSNSAS